jgi:hypothetical protein
VLIRCVCVSPRLLINMASVCQLTFICVSTARVPVNLCVLVQRVCVGPRLLINAASVC